MKEKFKTIKVSGDININLGDKGIWEADKETLLYHIKEVCEEYHGLGYTLTLRQMYYQLVSKDLIPNHDKVYKKLGKLKDDLLYGGYVDWDIFVDRGRVPYIAYTEHNIKGALQRTVNSYNLNKQLNQETHLEVWTEKDAISGIIKRAVNPYTVRVVVNKGYTSSTAIYDSYQRFLDIIQKGQKVVILYFGDHDPSGLDMIRDIRDRVMNFFLNGDGIAQLNGHIVDWASSDEIMDEVEQLSEEDEELFDSYVKEDKNGSAFQWVRYFFDKHFEVVPIGLTMEQIEKYNPPPNPAKMTDPRSKPYIKKFGNVSWEVDALRPEVMTDIVQTKILEYMDYETYQDVLDREKIEIAELQDMVDNINK